MPVEMTRTAENIKHSSSPKHGTVQTEKIQLENTSKFWKRKAAPVLDVHLVVATAGIFAKNDVHPDRQLLGICDVLGLKKLKINHKKNKFTVERLWTDCGGSETAALNDSPDSTGKRGFMPRIAKKFINLKIIFHPKALLRGRWLISLCFSPFAVPFCLWKAGTLPERIIVRRPMFAGFCWNIDPFLLRIFWRISG